MDSRALIARLTAIAADYDLEADSLFRKARRGGVCAAAEGDEAAGKRNDAVFLRRLAEELDRDAFADDLARIAGGLF